MNPNSAFTDFGYVLIFMGVVTYIFRNTISREITEGQNRFWGFNFTKKEGLRSSIIFSISCIITGVLFLMGVIHKKETSMEYDSSCALKISVMKNGDIHANGVKASLEEINSLLNVNSKSNGVVWYYREASQEEPSPQAMKIIQLVIEHKRPISMSSKADFSDVIDQNGRSSPR